MAREAGDGRLELTPVARIRSDFPEKFGIPRQSGLVRTLTARVVFEPEFRDPAALRGVGGSLMVTPRDIDQRVKDLAKVIGFGIDLALHPRLSVEDVELFLS